MVSSINATNVLNKATLTSKQDDIKTLVKYTNNEVLKEVPDTFTSTIKSGLGTAAVFEGFPLLKFLKNGKKVRAIKPSSGSEILVKDAMKALDEKTSKAFKNIFTGKEGKLGERISNFISTQNQVRKDFINLKDAAKSGKKAADAVRKGKNYEAMISRIDDATKAADYFVDPKKIDLQRAQQAVDKAAEALAKNHALD